MKGRLFLKDDKWYVQYEVINSLRVLILHKDSLRQLSLRSDKQPEHIHMEEIEFEIVTEYSDMNTNMIQKYAKLTKCNGLNFKKPTELIDDRQAYLETLARVLAKTWFYGDWKWETPNERVMQFIMVQLGLYPFFNEDDMISKTQVSEDYYKLAANCVPTRTGKEKTYTEEEMIEWTMTMIAQYAVGNTNIWNRELLKESLPKNR